MNKKFLKNFFRLKFVFPFLTGLTAAIAIIIGLSLQQKLKQVATEKNSLERRFASIAAELRTIKKRDEYKINQELQQTIKKIESTYQQAVQVYEKLLDLKTVSKKTEKLDELLTDLLVMLSKKNYASAEAGLNLLSKKIEEEKNKIAASFVIPQNVIQSNTPPGSGYQRQVVKTDIGEFLVDVVSADLNSTRVIVDTAADSDCRNDCPVLSLADYVGRNGAFAAVNGSYFCPAAYPSCSDKKNSFDTLLMNKNKVYFNSDNNVYSTVPAVIFSGNSVRFVAQSLEWGRDTGVDAVIANQPLLVLNGNVVFGGDNEIKRAGKGSRSFVGNSGSTVYIGVVHNVNAAEMARVLAAMGMENALNLDSGGSTALWYGGYKVGPGRNIPNAILLVGK